MLNISKPDFIFWINFIKEYDNEIVKVEKTLENIFEDGFCILKISTFSNKILKFLEEKCNDKDTISWWLYEVPTFAKCDDNYKITFPNENKDFIVETVDQLYDFLEYFDSIKDKNDKNIV